jgi:hypothetical protein
MSFFFLLFHANKQEMQIFEMKKINKKHLLYLKEEEKKMMMNAISTL